MKKFCGFREDPAPDDYLNATLPPIDKTRYIAVYVRQSKSGADDAHGESRDTQLKLVEFAVKLIGNADKVILYDEGAGVSGRKRIDQRKELNQMYSDTSQGLVGTVIVAREDRLFRDKHGNQSGLYTELAEKMNVLTIVPPIVTKSISVYDFSNYEHLKKFKDKMQAAYDYIVFHVGYMEAMKEKKAGRGEWDGRFLPPGLVVEKEPANGIQKPLLYQPWADVMGKLAKRAEQLNWNWRQLYKEIAALPFLFPEPSEEDEKQYWFKNRLDKAFGYKPAQESTLKRWFSNVSLIGWWLIKEKEGRVIKNNHPAILPIDTFERCFSSITGYTLDGEKVAPIFVTRKRQTNNTNEPIEALFHGRISIPCNEEENERSMVSTLHQNRAKGRIPCYSGAIKKRGKDTYPRVVFTLPCLEFDSIIIARMKELAQTDKNIKEKIEQGLENIRSQQAIDFVSIEDSLKALEKRKKAIAKRLLIISPVDEEEEGEDDEEGETKKESEADKIIKKLATELQEVEHTISQLNAKKKKLNIVDGNPELKRFHSVLENFDKRFPKLKLEDKQKLFSLLVSSFSIETISPHWLKITLHWLPALYPRPDIALVWRNNPQHPDGFTPEEKKIVKELFPRGDIRELRRMLPGRTYASIICHAHLSSLKRLVPERQAHELPRNACWKDLYPYGENQEALFGDEAQTIECIREGINHTQKVGGNSMYPIWLFSPSLAELKQLSLDDSLSSINNDWHRPITINQGYISHIVLTSLQAALPELERLLA